MKSLHLSSKLNRRIFAAAIVILLMLSATGASAASGALDTSFGTNGFVLSDLGGDNDSGVNMVLQPDGKILVSALQSVGGVSTPVVVRYTSTGQEDSTFGINGRLVSPLIASRPAQIGLQSDGKIILADSAAGRIAVVRFDSNGTTLDNTFGVSGAAVFYDTGGFSQFDSSDIAIQTDNKILVVGTERNQGNFTNIIVVRFNANGTMDDTFVSSGSIILDKINFPNNRYNNGKAVVVQTDGKIVLSGDMMDDNADDQITLARLNPDGSMDTAGFGTNGQGTVMVPLTDFHNNGGSLAMQSNGKIVVGGSIIDDVDNSIQDLALARFNSNGALDTTFNSTGIVVTDLGNTETENAFAIQGDGKILVAGVSIGPGGSDLLLVRYTSAGALDSTFGVNGVAVSDFNGGVDSGRSLAIRTDGLILATGSSNGDVLLARYLGDPITKPTVTSTFQSIGGFDGWILESGETTNTGGMLNKLATTVNVGDDGADRQYRSILSFNTAGLPDNAVVVSAQFKIKRQGIVGQNPFSTHGKLLLDPRLGLFSNNINLQLTDFNAASNAAKSVETVTASSTLNWYSVTLSVDNNLLINKYGVTQFRLRFTKDDNDDLGADYVKFFSGEAVDANRPQLVIKYYLP